MKLQLSLAAAALSLCAFAQPALATKNENKGACEYSWGCRISDENDFSKKERVTSAWLCEQDPKVSCPDHVTAVVKRIEDSYKRNTKGKDIHCYEVDRRWTPEGSC